MIHRGHVHFIEKGPISHFLLHGPSMEIVTSGFFLREKEYLVKFYNVDALW